MKKAFVAALSLSLLAGTSAFAQDMHQRGQGGDWRDRVAPRQQQQQQNDDHDRRDDRRRPRQQSEDTRPARPVPQVANPRAEEAIAAARGRQSEHDNVVVQRRNDRANEAIAEARQRQNDRRGDDHDRRQPPQRYVVPRVAPPAEQRRYDRRDNNDGQRVYIRPGVHRDNDADRRAEVQRRLQERERTWDRDRDRNRDHDRDRYRRPGEGHELRDRDRGRHWYNPDQWRRSYWAQHRYRVRPYRYPSGWYVRTWIFGDYLPHGWYGQSYYLDWWRYGLPMPPIGSEWVRVGDDALLVDTWSGEVLSVYYDLFW